MKRNMKQWVTDYINAPTKKSNADPFFPGCTAYWTYR